MGAYSDLHRELENLTYQELNHKWINGEIDWNTFVYFADKTDDYMWMAQDIEITEVQYGKE